MTATGLLYGGCAGLYGCLAALILGQARRSRTGLFLACACLVTVAWAGTIAMAPHSPFGAFAVILELLRPAAWCAFVMHLYRRTVLAGRHRSQALAILAMLALLMLVVVLFLERNAAPEAVTLWSAWMIGRLGLAVASLLLIENLYLNTPEDIRWHINLPCVALGALSIYDIALAGDALLFRQLSLVLFNGRALATAIVAPLLALAAARNRGNWDVNIHVSRSVVFHSATLIVSGIFLLGLVFAGEAFRYIGADWGGIAEISLIFAGLVTVVVVLTSRSARSRMRSMLIEHFFTHRYDYRREWMRCITTLSTPDAYVALHTRVIRAIVEIVDSPGGILFLREPNEQAFQWSGSWNMPTANIVMADHPLISRFRGGDWIVEIAQLATSENNEMTEVAGTWLAVPLNHAGRLTGFILTARPRASFKLDREVFDLLRIVGRQVATYVAEQRATEILLQTRELHEYGKRFAFVAHDIKNVSSQLSLLLSNAEIYLDNPEFQRDMLATIRASVQKIGALIKRLQIPESEVAQSVIMPGERLEAIMTNCRRVRGVSIELKQDEHNLGVAMQAAAFDAVVTHILNNAIEAGPAEPISISLRHEARQALIDIVDRGPGMTPEFIRDQLFRPFRTSKSSGSGIGAFQARELLREAGGDLLVISRPGVGTTMRLLLPLVETTAARTPKVSV